MATDVPELKTGWNFTEVPQGEINAEEFS